MQVQAEHHTGMRRRRRKCCQQHQVMAALAASEHASTTCLAVAAAYACRCSAALIGERTAVMQQASDQAVLELEAAHCNARLVRALEDAAVLREQIQVAAEQEATTTAEHAQQVRSSGCICNYRRSPSAESATMYPRVCSAGGDLTEQTAERRSGRTCR